MKKEAVKLFKTVYLSGQISFILIGNWSHPVFLFIPPHITVSKITKIILENLCFEEIIRG